ncbi:hypothetical protein PAECIP112173_00914 [Paenibacillus sp. JJ-100]|nr:hypothetical protein PAECIP112173_00914 [Paenibacillus sp. JJ-100]
MTYIIILASILLVGMIGMGWFYKIVDEDKH